MLSGKPESAFCFFEKGRCCKVENVGEIFFLNFLQENKKEDLWDLFLRTVSWHKYRFVVSKCALNKKQADKFRNRIRMFLTQENPLKRNVFPSAGISCIRKSKFIIQSRKCRECLIYRKSYIPFGTSLLRGFCHARQTYAAPS